MWYVITKLVANCKDDVQLIKMVNFEAVVLFIRILINFSKEKEKDGYLPFLDVKACVGYFLSNFISHQVIALQKLWKMFFF